MVKYQKLQPNELLHDRMVRIVKFLYHGLFFCLGRLLLTSRPFKHLFPSTTKKVLGKIQTANATSCHSDVNMLLCMLYTASQHGTSMYFYQTTRYRGLSDRQKCKGMGGLNSADCRPAKLTDKLPCQPIAV